MGIAVLVTLFGGEVTNFKLLVLSCWAGPWLAPSSPSAWNDLHARTRGHPTQLRGRAAVLVGIVSFLDPPAQYDGTEKLIHEIEIVLGVFIGGITFTGSVVAFGKLRGSIGSKPLLLPARHWLNLAMVLGSVWFGWQFTQQAHDPLSKACSSSPPSP